MIGRPLSVMIGIGRPVELTRKLSWLRRTIALRVLAVLASRKLSGPPRQGQMLRRSAKGSGCFRPMLSDGLVTSLSARPLRAPALRLRTWDETTPRTDDYNERNNLFTGQIDNVTVELK
jgi:hypothetical protein